MSLEALSIELQQAILGYLDFISLLKIKNTSKVWRDRVNNALSKSNIILPARAKLLELYLELPSSLPSSPPDDIEPFVGEKYLSYLRAEIAQHAPNLNLGIPAEFELWILEWPPMTILGFTWFTEEYGEDDGGIGCSNPGKMLSYLSIDEDAPVVGIYVRSHGCQDYSVLFFEAGKKSDGVVWKGDICEMEEEFDDWRTDECLAASWVDWLRMELNNEL